MSIHKRAHTSNRRAFKQVKRLFMIAGIVEAEGTCDIQQVVDLFNLRIGDPISERQIRRDLILLAELGVIDE